MVDFIIILIVLQKFLFKKVGNVLKEREAIIKESITNAKEAKERKEEMDQRYKDLMKEAQKEVDQILEGTRISAEKLREEILNTTEIEAKKILDTAASDIAKDHDRMYETLKKEMKGVALDITKKILEKNLDSHDRDIILKKSIQYLENEK